MRQNSWLPSSQTTTKYLLKPENLSVFVSNLLYPVMTIVNVQIRASIEEQRLLLGLKRSQVLICTDLFGSTSGTYEADVSSHERDGGLENSLRKGGGSINYLVLRVLFSIVR